MKTTIAAIIGVLLAVAAHAPQAEARKPARAGKALSSTKGRWKAQLAAALEQVKLLQTDLAKCRDQATTLNKILTQTSAIPAIQANTDKIPGLSATLQKILEAVTKPTTPVQTEFNVKMVSFGGSKLAVIKVVKETIPGLGLREAKTLVESAPVVIKEKVTKAIAEEIKAKLAAAGATVVIE